MIYFFRSLDTGLSYTQNLRLSILFVTSMSWLKKKKRVWKGRTSTTLLVGAIAYFREVTYDLPKKFVKNRSAKGGHTSSSPWGENLALERGTQCFDPVPGLVAIVQAYRCRNFDAKSNNNEQA